MLALIPARKWPEISGKLTVDSVGDRLSGLVEGGLGRVGLSSKSVIEQGGKL